MLVGKLLLVGGLLSAGSGHAQGLRPSLNWVRLPGAETCIPPGQLAEAIETRVGRAIFAPPSEGELFVDGAVEPAGQDATGYRVRLWVTDAQDMRLGERTLASADPDCRALDEAIILVVAVTLYPKSALLGAGIPLDPGVSAQLDALFGDEPSELSPGELTPAPDAAAKAAKGTETRSKRPPAARVARPASPPTPPSLRLGLDVVGAGSLGLSPQPAAAAGLRVGLDLWSRGRLELGASVWTPGTAEASSGEGRLDYTRANAGLTGCGERIRWLLGARPCLGLEGGMVRVDAHGFVFDEPPKTLWLAELTGGLLLREPLWRDMRYRVALTFGIPMIRRDYLQSTPAGPEPVYETPGGNLRLEAGVGWDP